MENRSFAANVRGVVQGVAFRYHTRRLARSLGLVGWVKNMPDGSVSLIAGGVPEALAQLAAWLEHGPPSARVTALDIDWRSDSVDAASFEITY